MQATRHLIGVVVELSAGMEHGHDNFCGRDALVMHFRGYTPAVITDGDGFIRVDDNVYLATMPRQRFVDRVVHQLEHHMVQPGAIICIPDVHPRALPHRIQALQDLNTGGVVIDFFFAHADLLKLLITPETCPGCGYPTRLKYQDSETPSGRLDPAMFHVEHGQ